jgi:hypothetical protein
MHLRATGANASAVSTACVAGNAAPIQPTNRSNWSNSICPYSSLMTSRRRLAVDEAASAAIRPDSRAPPVPLPAGEPNIARRPLAPRTQGRIVCRSQWRLVRRSSDPLPPDRGASRYAATVPPPPPECTSSRQIGDVPCRRRIRLGRWFTTCISSAWRSPLIREANLSTVGASKSSRIGTCTPTHCSTVGCESANRSVARGSGVAPLPGNAPRTSWPRTSDSRTTGGGPRWSQHDDVLGFWGADVAVRAL